MVLFVARNRNRERNEPDAAPDAFILTSNRGLVICPEPQLELRSEFEVLTIKKSSRDRVTARHLFDHGLVQSFPRIAFVCCYEPCAVQLCEVIAYRLPIREEETAEIGCLTVIAEDISQGFKKCAFAVCPGSVQQKQGMLACLAG